MNLAAIKRPSANVVTLLATIAVFVLLYGLAAARYHDRNFFTLPVFIDFFRDNAYLGVAAVGMTFVILSGGIDLSVGGVVGLTGILLATMIEQKNMHPGVAMPIVLAIGTLLGTLMGFMIHYFQLAPFFVTLAGMFLARGLALVISSESIGLDPPLFLWLTEHAVIPLGGRNRIPFVAIVFVAVAAIGIFVARCTPFGRNTYAIGGNEPSAVLMGLPVGRTKVGVYALSGFCSALAGVVWSLSLWSGNANAGSLMELDAIAAVVLGGTLLSGGVGSVFGTVFGVLILAIIQTSLNFEGTLSSWWTKIAIGMLLLAFITMQRLLTKLGAVRASP